MSVHTISFPELAYSTAAWLLFRIYIPEQVRNSCWYFKPNSPCSVKKKVLRKLPLNIGIMKSYNG